MKSTKWLILLLVVLLLPAGAFAGISLEGLSAHESYTLALEAFNAGDFSGAAEQFSHAGNYQDAKKWRYYSQAISDVISNTASVADAQNRFLLLSAQSFQQAGQWATYCNARSYELNGFIYDAANLYAEVLVYDSVERYLTCLGQAYSGMLDSAETVRSRQRDAIGSPAALYEEAKELYRYDFYADAADYFCLAGNYSDARQWRCYCTAIDLIVSHEDIARAEVLFSLLSKHDFADASDWLIYCDARNSEASGFTSEAIDLYMQIFLHDSSERYLDLLKKISR